MNEPTLLDRIRMIITTVASIVAWVVALGVTFVRGKLKGSSSDS